MSTPRTYTGGEWRNSSTSFESQHLDECEWLTSRSGRYTTAARALVSLNKRLVGPQSVDLLEKRPSFPFASARIQTPGSWVHGLVSIPTALSCLFTSNCVTQTNCCNCSCILWSFVVFVTSIPAEGSQVMLVTTELCSVTAWCRWVHQGRPEACRRPGQTN
jgi:hypothetical protein